VILARTPLLSRSVRHWRIGCRGHKVKHPQLQQDLESADGGARSSDLRRCPTRSNHRKLLRIHTRILTSLFNILITYPSFRGSVGFVHQHCQDVTLQISLLAVGGGRRRIALVTPLAGYTGPAQAETRSSRGLGKVSSALSSPGESQLSSLLCLARTIQPSTILARHRSRITPTLSFSKWVVGPRVSIFSRTRSVSLPTSNGFTMISSASS